MMSRSRRTPARWVTNIATIATVATVGVMTLPHAMPQDDPPGPPALELPPEDQPGEDILPPEAPPAEELPPPPPAQPPAEPPPAPQPPVEAQPEPAPPPRDTSECAAPAHIEPDTSEEVDQAKHELRKLATGAGVRVAVVDTGIAHHPELDQLIAGRDFVNPDTPDPFFDCDSHGTVVAGIIGGTSRGIAPDAEILAIRQTTAQYHGRPPGGGDVGSLQTLADAIHHALDERARVINISVVSCIAPNIADRVDLGVVDDALARAEAEGAVVIAAAGNATDSCEEGFTVIPAHFPTVIAVGAREDAYKVASYSIPSPDRHVSAPGFVPVALASDGAGWAGGTLDRRGEDDTAVVPYVGTSFAAPVVSGSVALLKQRYPHFTPQQIRDLVYASAQPNGGAIEPFEVVSQLVPDPVNEREPLVVAPGEHQNSQAAQRWWAAVVLAIAALGCIAAARGATGRVSPADT